MRQKETEVALAAIDALCKKRTAKAIRRLVLRAIEAERADAVSLSSNPFGGITYTDLGATITATTTDAGHLIDPAGTTIGIYNT